MVVPLVDVYVGEFLVDGGDYALIKTTWVELELERHFHVRCGRNGVVVETRLQRRKSMAREVVDEALKFRVDEAKRVQVVAGEEARQRLEDAGKKKKAEKAPVVGPGVVGGLVFVALEE